MLEVFFNIFNFIGLLIEILHGGVTRCFLFLFLTRHPFQKQIISEQLGSGTSMRADAVL